MDKSAYKELMVKIKVDILLWEKRVLRFASQFTHLCIAYSQRTLSISGNCTVTPSADPRGMIVALCNGIAPGV